MKNYNNIYKQNDLLQTFNTYRNGIWSSPKQSGCSVHRSAAYSIPNDTPIDFIFDTIINDFQSEYNATTGRFTAKESGRYLINFKCFFENANWPAGTYASIYLIKNGALTEIFAKTTVETAYTFYLSLLGSTIIDLVSGDYINIQIYHSRGGATNLFIASYRNNLKIQKIA